MKKKKELSKQEYDKRKKTLLIFKITMIIIDIFSIVYLIYQLINKQEIFYSTYIVLLLCNLATFIMKPDSFC